MNRKSLVLTVAALSAITLSLSACRLAKKGTLEGEFGEDGAETEQGEGSAQGDDLESGGYCSAVSVYIDQPNANITTGTIGQTGTFQRVAQGFVMNEQKDLSSIEIYGDGVTGPNTTLTIYADTGGAPDAGPAVASASITPIGTQWHLFDFSAAPITLQAGNYYLVITTSSAYIKPHFDSSTNPYAGGCVKYWHPSLSWVNSAGGCGWDMKFRVNVCE